MANTEGNEKVNTNKKYIRSKDIPADKANDSPAPATPSTPGVMQPKVLPMKLLSILPKQDV